MMIRIDPDNAEHPILAVANDPGTAAEAKGENPQVSGEIARDTNPDTLALDGLGSESLPRSEDDLSPGQAAELPEPDHEVTAVADLAVRDPKAVLTAVEAEVWPLIVRRWGYLTKHVRFAVTDPRRHMSATWQRTPASPRG